jgi:hypothetical protein
MAADGGINKAVDGGQNKAADSDEVSHYGVPE